MHNKVSVAEFFWHLLPVAVLRLAALMKERSRACTKRNANLNSVGASQPGRWLVHIAEGGCISVWACHACFDVIGVKLQMAPHVTGTQCQCAGACSCMPKFGQLLETARKREVQFTCKVTVCSQAQRLLAHLLMTSVVDDDTLKLMYRFSTMLIVR